MHRYMSLPSFTIDIYYKNRPRYEYSWNILHLMLSNNQSKNQSKFDLALNTHLKYSPIKFQKQTINQLIRIKIISRFLLEAMKTTCILSDGVPVLE